MSKKKKRKKNKNKFSFYYNSNKNNVYGYCDEASKEQINEIAVQVFGSLYYN